MRRIEGLRADAAHAAIVSTVTSGATATRARPQATRPGQASAPPAASPQDRPSDGEVVPTSLPPQAGPVVICLLGPFMVLGQGQPVAVRGTKTEALLRALALRRGGLPREELLAQLWPDRDQTLAAQSLNSLVYGAQRLFRGMLAGASAIVHDDAGYRLDGGVDVDVLHFDALLSTGDHLVHAGDSDGARRAFVSAVELYRGDLRVWGGVTEIVERERLRAGYLNALAHLADAAFAQAHYASALEYALRILAADPCREDAHRLVMRCRVRRGERAQALRQFQLCETILRAEFDAPPEPATQAIYDQIRLNPDGV